MFTRLLRRHLPRLALSLLLAAAALAAPASAAAEHPVLAAEHARRSALLAGDVSALDRLLAADLRYTHSNGKVENKAVILADIRSGQLTYERFELDRLHVHEVTPGVAVLTGAINQRKRQAGKPNDALLFFQGVWRLAPPGWQLVSLQTALRPPAP
jgi:hypothetical protein